MNSIKRPVTLEEIEAISSETLCPADVIGYLRTSQNTINKAAESGTLPWAYKLGKRTIIPKKAFVNYHKYGQVSGKNDNQ